MGRFKCGHDDGLPASEDWKNDIACQVCGCRQCQNFNGTEYFQKDIPKGISMWAKHEREQMK